MAEAGHTVTDEAHHVEPRHSKTAFGIVFCIAQHGRFHNETDCGLYMGGICRICHLTFLFVYFYASSQENFLIPFPRRSLFA